MFAVHDMISLFEGEEEIEMLDRGFSHTIFDKYSTEDIITDDRKPASKKTLEAMMRRLHRYMSEAIHLEKFSYFPCVSSIYMSIFLSCEKYDEILCTIYLRSRKYELCTFFSGERRVFDYVRSMCMEPFTFSRKLARDQEEWIVREEREEFSICDRGISSSVSSFFLYSSESHMLMMRMYITDILYDALDLIIEVLDHPLTLSRGDTDDRSFARIGTELSSIARLDISEIE
jgi:hypothetical protein